MTADTTDSSGSGTEEPEVPADPLAAAAHLNNLLFLTIAKKTLIPAQRGGLARLGEQTGMTGPGAAARLEKLDISTKPTIDAAQIQSRIDDMRRALAPYLPLLRSVLRL
jgi:hypothetical protein